jgi:16S rRNA (cytosine1402-N4)-methyltransferase
MSPLFHDPVLVKEVVDLLVTNQDGVYVDCTVGGGGHSKLILEKLSPKGRLIGIDRDEEALAEAQKVLDSRATLLHISFSNQAREISKLVSAPISGILMDLGVSSHQLDEADRGFSYRTVGPLDLRMDRSRGKSAAELLSEMDLDELTRIIRVYGEDPQARRIARAIYAENSIQSIKNTEHLADVIRKTVPATHHKSLPRVFQALRIAVNTEMAELEAGLSGAWDLLQPGGRLAVISYHSLEDRRAKLFFNSKSSPSGFTVGPARLAASNPTGKRITRKPITPSDREIELNPRARSAKLRVIEKL